MSSFRLEELATIESVVLPPRKRRAQRSEVRKVKVTGQLGGRKQPGGGAEHWSKEYWVEESQSGVHSCSQSQLLVLLQWRKYVL